MIDSNIFFDVENGRLDFEALSVFSKYEDAFIAAVTASELLSGVHMTKKVGTRLLRAAFVESILAKMPLLEFEEVARTYAEIYTYFMKPRVKSVLGVYDLQIAATA